MNRWWRYVLLSTVPALISPALARTPYEGLSGAALAEAIRAIGTPEKLLLNHTGPVSVWSVVGDYATMPDGKLFDYFADNGSVTLPTDPYEVPVGVSLVEVVPLSWWEASPQSKSPLFDLHNLVVCTDDSEDMLVGRIPAEKVDRISCFSAGWTTGTTMFGDVEVAVYLPPVNLRGDFARMLMYCATVYPCAIWHGEGVMIYADGETYPPLLSAYAQGLLLDWHRADAPDAFELRRDKAISRAQGNGNPFVSHPELAEYLWGVRKGETFVDTDNRGRAALKASYTKSSDAFIDLYSPYIDENVEWRFDGTELGTSPEPIPTAGIAPGRYLIEYAAPDRNVAGELLIDVVP